MTGCNPCPETPCPHCDRPCSNVLCSTCRSIKFGTNNAVAQLARTPAPPAHVIHDQTPPACGTCGGPVCDTETGPWCPTPFCP